MTDRDPQIQRLSIRFTGANRAMVLIGIARRWSYVDVGPELVRVRLSWGFAVDVPRHTVRSAVADHDAVWGWGAHGWRGVWLVNGSSSGIVRIDLSTPARGRVAFLPVRVVALRVAMDDPEGLIAALAAS
ncbi:MAG: hypothetical protein ABL966_05505 [Acidimicrobiales bacterium]